MTDADDRERRFVERAASARAEANQRDASADYDQTYGDLAARERAQALSAFRTQGKILDEVNARLDELQSENARLQCELDHVLAARRADPCHALVQAMVACEQPRGHRGDHEGTSSVISWPQDTPPQPSPPPPPSPGLYCATVDHGDRPAAAVGTVEAWLPFGHDKRVRVAYCAECTRTMSKTGLFQIQPWPGSTVDEPVASRRDDHD